MLATSLLEMLRMKTSLHRHYDRRINVTPNMNVMKQMAKVLGSGIAAT